MLLTVSAHSQSAPADSRADDPLGFDLGPHSTDCDEFSVCGAIAGRIFLDLSADGFSADDTPQGGVAVELFADDGDGQFDDATDTPLEMVVSDDDTGQYSFDPPGDGLYFVREVPPAGFTRTAGPAHFSLLVRQGQIYSVADLALDDFRAPDPAESLFVSADPELLKQSGLSGVLGGERDILVDVLGNPSPLSASILVGGAARHGSFSFASSTPGASVVLQYDGADADDFGPPAALENAQGLNHDLTDGGMHNGLLFVFDRVDPGAAAGLDWEIRLTSGETVATFFGLLSEGVTPQSRFVTFDSFTTDSGFSFAAINSMEVIFNRQRAANVDFELSLIMAAADQPGGFDFANAALPVVSVSNAAPIIEGESARFEVALDRPAIVPVELTFEISDGTALAGSDYLSPPATILIESGASSATIVVQTVDDDLVESEESFFLRLISAAGATINTEADLGEAQIKDNDELPPPSVGGRKWLDVDGDGRQDEGEPGLPGVTIYLDLNGNAALDDAEPNTITGADGSYRFDNLSPGMYVIREVVGSGFVQTSQPDHYTVLVHGGQVFSVAGAAVDDFRQPDPAGSLFVTALNANPAVLQQRGLAGVIGGERDVLLNVLGVAGPLSASVLVGREDGQGVFSFASANPGTAVTLQYDGVDDDPTGPPAALVNARRLEHDLTDGGARSGLLFVLDRIDPGSAESLAWEIRATSGEATATFTGLLDASVIPTAGFVPFADFSTDSGFSFAAVDSLEIVFNPQGVANVDFEFSMIISATPQAAGYDFGNHQPQPGAIQGMKFADENVNGVRDALAGNGETALEPGLAGFRIYLDLNNNATLDAGEPVEVTGADGRYEFTDVAPGTYVVREVLDGGFVQTLPGEPAFSHTITIVDGETIAGVDFGNVALPVVSLADAETVIEGETVHFTVTLSRPAVVPIELTIMTGDGTALAGEDYQSRSETITIAVGATSATVQVQTLNDQQAEDQEFFVLRIVSAVGATVNSAADQAQALIDDDDDDPPPRGSIAGRKWLDRDGDGLQGEGEPGLPGVTIYLDLNGNSVLDEGDQSTVTGEGGDYQFNDLPAGDYTVREIVPAGFLQTFPTAQQGAAHTISIAAGQMIDDADFGNQPRPSLGVITGRVFSDDDFDRTADAGERGMPDIVVYLDSNGNGMFDSGEPNTITDADGNYRFEDLAPGTYVVREIVPSATLQTLPGVTRGFAHTVVVTAAGEVTQVDFGNHVTFGPPPPPPPSAPAPAKPPRIIDVPEGFAVPAQRAAVRQQPPLSRDGGGDAVKRVLARNIALVQLAEILFIDPAIEEELDELLIVLADATAPDLLRVDPGDPPEKPPAPSGLEPLSELRDPKAPEDFQMTPTPGGAKWWYAAILPAVVGAGLVWRFRNPLVRQIKALLT